MKKFYLFSLMLFAALTARAQVSTTDFYVYYPAVGKAFVWHVNYIDPEGEYVVNNLIDTILTYDPSHLTDVDGYSAGFINDITVSHNGQTYNAESETPLQPEDASMAYWMYNINDASAQLGCSSQPVTDGDRILWEYKYEWTSWDCTAVAALPSVEDMGTVGPEAGEDEPVVEPIEGPATFEEYAAVLPAAGGLYDPNTADGTEYWQSGNYVFPATCAYSGYMHDGFYPANYYDTAYASYDDAWKAVPCSGANGSDTYCSFYYGGSWGGPSTIAMTEAAIVSGTYAAMTINPYLCIHGRSWCNAFAEGDYQCLHFAGKLNGSYTGTSVDFYLVDYRNSNRFEATDWTWVDLTGLGTVDEIEVSIMDSQAGAGVGAYACFDDFGGVAPATTAIRNTTEVESNKVLMNGRVVIIREGRMFDLTGRAL